jgi:hypothetical protein
MKAVEYLFADRSALATASADAAPEFVNAVRGWCLPPVELLERVKLVGLQRLTHRCQEDAAPGVPSVAAENATEKGFIIEGVAKGNAWGH